jgi:lauroyl/myristoyl acyltransferase
MFIAVKDLYYLAVIALVKITSWSSSHRQRERVVRGIAWSAYRLSRTKRQLVEWNLSEAFDEALSEDQKRKIVKATFYAFWADMFSWLPSGAERAKLKRAEVHGIERLHEALRNERGVILWESNGFAGRHVAKQILHEHGCSIQQVHGATDVGGFLTDDSSATWVRRSLVKRFFQNCERRFVSDIIYLPSSSSLAFTRALLTRLKQNAIVCSSGDGKVGQKLIPIRFLGRTEFFTTGMVSLAKLSGASILPMFCIQENDEQTTLIIERPIHIDTSVERERGLQDCVAQYANLLESYIRRYPGHYRNWHALGESARR